MIIYTNQKSKRKPQKNSKKKELAASWEVLMKKWDVKPNETKGKNRLESPNYHYDDRGWNSIKSLSNSSGVAVKQPPKVYTGDAMLGIATMHKSNSVPVFKQKDAEDISRMRR